LADTAQDRREGQSVQPTVPVPVHDARPGVSGRTLLAVASVIWLGTALWFATRYVTTYDSAFTVVRWREWSRWAGTTKSVMEMRTLITATLVALGARDLYRCLRQQAERLPRRPERWLRLTTALCGLVVVADLVVRVS
jgi:hypothetical protein